MSVDVPQHPVSPRSGRVHCGGRLRGRDAHQQGPAPQPLHVKLGRRPRVSWEPGGHTVPAGTACHRAR